MFDYKDYKMTGNVAVDMVAACVLTYRKQQRALKSVKLRPAYFGKFRLWVKKEFGEEAAISMRYEFDGVHVDLGTRFQLQPLEVEFWPELPKAN